MNGKPPPGTFKPLMIEGKYVHWAPFESLTLAGAYLPALLSSADVSNTVLLYDLALSIASIKQGPLDVYSNADSVQHYLLILFNFQTHHKLDMTHIESAPEIIKLFGSKYQKPKLGKRSWIFSSVSSFICFCLLFKISTLFWIHIQNFLVSEFTLISEV